MTRLSLAAVLAVALLAAPPVASAQDAGRAYRLGILSPSPMPDPSVATTPNLVPGALQELGYVEGRNLVVVRRFAEGRSTDSPASRATSFSSEWT